MGLCDKLVMKMRKSVIWVAGLLSILVVALLGYSYEAPDIQKIQSKLEQIPTEDYIYVENATLYAVQNASTGIERITAYHLIYLKKSKGKYTFNGSVRYYVNGVYKYGYSIYFEFFGGNVSGYVNVNGTMYDIKDKEWEKITGITREELIQREIYSSFRIGRLKILLNESKWQLKQRRLFSGTYEFKGVYKGSKVELITNSQISKITINIETPYGSKIHKELILGNKSS